MFHVEYLRTLAARDAAGNRRTPQAADSPLRDFTPLTPPGSGFGTTVVPCQVKLAGGSAGDASSPCTYTYDLYTPMSYGQSGAQPFVLARPMYCGRTAVGRYDAAPNGTLGLALRVTDGATGVTTWYLMACQEVPHVTACKCT